MKNLLLTFVWWQFTISITAVVVLLAIILIPASKAHKRRKTSARMINGYSRLKVGMSEDEVISLLGTPTGTRALNGIETLTWKHSEFKGWARGGTIVRSITADFENKVLTGFDSDNMDRPKW